MIFGLSAGVLPVMLIQILPIYPVRNAIGILLVIRQDRDFSGVETLKEEKHCTLPANQQTMQAQMDGRGNPFQGLGSDSFDPLSLWERVNGDMDLLRDLVELFAAEYPELLLNIKDAIDQGKSVEVQRFSHKLKGSALQFSGKLAAAAAGKLEEMGRTESLDGAGQVLVTLELEVVGLMEALKVMVGLQRPVM